MSTANTVIQVKKSGVTGNTPVGLNTGELALNYADGKIFYLNSNDGISSIENQNTFSTINVNSTLLVANSITDTLKINSGEGIVISANDTDKSITISATGEHFGSLLTSSVSSNQVLDSYNPETYRTCKYLIQALSGTQVHSCEVILTHNDMKTSLSQYGIIKSTRFNLFTLDSDIVSGNVVLYITPANDNTQIDFIRTSIVSRTLPV
jgi:hypothetical protein